MSLILTRKETESIQIGDDITVTIHYVQGRKVQLAIDAPEDVPIFRTELLDNEDG